MKYNRFTFHVSRRQIALLVSLSALTALTALGCGDGEPLGSGGQGGNGLTGASSTAAGTSSGSGQGGQGGASATTLEGILAELRKDLPGTMTKYAASDGWPVHVEGKYLFVSTSQTLTMLAGDHNGWAGATMTTDAGFSWTFIDVPLGDLYKLTDGSTYEADPWARSYNYDGNGEISMVLPSKAHLDRFFGISDANMPPRDINVWVPEGTPTHVLYAHDGQNLFNPQAAFGGWMVQDSVPLAMMIVGIDNTGNGRMDEYTHVTDLYDLDGNGTLDPWGGKGDQYADFINGTVRNLIKNQYGEPAKIGTMGSSLGGLIAFHIADRFPGEYLYAASLSGTMGWGSMDPTSHNETMIERYKAHGHQATVLYLDAGGGDPALTQAANESQCKDADNDGIKDDFEIGDNACENAQMRDTLKTVGYTVGTDVFHWWEAGGQHNEAEWRARVFRPLDLFGSL